ncbi:MAG: glucosaminidase domain-containing protein [Acidimicrobiales bacterium]
MAAAGAAPGCTAVMGQSANTADQMAGWFATTGRNARLDVSVLDLTKMFVEEGAREGVRGDIAFAQSIVETGHFGFSPAVAPETHNYSGIGATGGGVKGASFPDARTGVRAQIQHLRAYADPSLRSAADLRAPLVDPRFKFIVPNSRPVPCWEGFGNGVWAADTSGYGGKVLVVHNRIAAFPRPKVKAEPPAPVVTAPPPPPVTIPAVAEPTLVPAVSPVEAAMSIPLLVDDEIALSRPVQAEQVLTSPTRSSQGGAAATAATGFTAMALITICATLWWHGRRFTRS